MWQSINKEVNDRIKSLEILHTDWIDYEKSIDDVLKWYEQQECRIVRHEGTIGHEIEVRNALRDCQVVEELVESKSHELEMMEKSGLKICSRGQIQSTIDRIQQAKNTLLTKRSNLQRNLLTLLDLWKQYNETLHIVSKCLTEAEYIVSKLKTISGRLDSFKSSLYKVKSFQIELKNSNIHLATLNNLTKQLIQVCEPSVGNELETSISDISIRWKAVGATMHMYEQALVHWESYENEYLKVAEWIEGKEHRVEAMIWMFFAQNSDADKNKQLESAKGLKLELDSYHSVSGLTLLINPLTGHADSTTIMEITAQQKSLQQKLDNMRKTVNKQVERMENYIISQRKFQDTLQTLTIWIDNIEEVIDKDDPNTSIKEKYIQDRMAELKSVIVKFINNNSQLDSLNEMGYKQSLETSDAQKLTNLNRKWNTLSNQTSERYRKLQGIWLQHQSFAQKCDAWMIFVAQIETNLSVNIAGNYKLLLEQQQLFELFESDIFNRQQILFSVISDGQKILKEFELDDQEEFKNKLILLTEQWQSVVKRASQRKEIIDQAIADWQTYRMMLDEMNSWFDGMDEEIAACEITCPTLLKLEHMLEQAENTQQEVSIQEGNFLSLNENGIQLMRISDRVANEVIKMELTDSQKRWYNITAALNKQTHKLEELIGQWNSAEQHIEDLQAWLIDTKEMLNGSLPCLYEELQHELQNCKQQESAFVTSQVKLKTLTTLEHELVGTINPEDLSILREKISLLAEQWDEIRHQTVNRKQVIIDKIHEWSLFAERYKELSDWFIKTEVKMSKNGENNIEGLLYELQHVSSVISLYNSK
ncbi:nesprin-1-like [Saccoglossus kowalevskii]